MIHLQSCPLINQKILCPTKFCPFIIRRKKTHGHFSRCIVGDFITEGEGNGKKPSKTRAAELMLDKLKELPPLASCQTTPKKKASSSSSAAAAARKKSKNLIKLEQKANPDYGQSINPISRLIQIQQAKKQKEPVYTLIAERGMPRRREFVMQVSVLILGGIFVQFLVIFLDILLDAFEFFFNVELHILGSKKGLKEALKESKIHMERS